MSAVVIMRGISGAGKTTWAKRHYPNAIFVSANDYFTDASGVYAFDPTKLDASHEDCFLCFMAAIADGDRDIVVDNTNIEPWELAPYVLAGRAYGFEIRIVTVESPASDAARRCIHCVPRATVFRQLAKLRAVELPRPWREEIVSGLQ